MLPIKRFSLNAGRRKVTLPVFCRACGKVIKQAKGNARNPREICSGCVKK
jgi:formylmethanofuran dehydrogenase subunit E